MQYFNKFNQMQKFQLQMQEEESYAPKKNDHKLVQKIVKSDFFSLNDAEISKYIIHDIPYYYHYFMPTQTQRPVTIKENFVQHSEKYILITAINRKTISFQEIFRFKSQLNICAQSFKDLLETCRILKKAQIVHFNFCADSVVFFQKKPILHHFSHSFLLHKMDEERKDKLFGKYSPYCTHWPVSCHVLCYMTQNRLKSLSIGMIHRVLEDYIENMTTAGFHFPEDYWKKFQENWIFSLHPLVNKSEKEITMKILAESCKWDIYSLCILYLQLAHFLIQMNPVLIQNVFIQKFIDFLKKNMQHFDNISYEAVISEFNLLLDGSAR